MRDPRERYDQALVGPLLDLGYEALRDRLAAERAALDASWKKRELFGPCPRPATRPTLFQLRLLARVELLEACFLYLAPAQPAAGKKIAPCEVIYHPYVSTAGKVEVICRTTGMVVESWGMGERSLARCFALLREECACGGWHAEGEAEEEDDEDDDASDDRVRVEGAVPEDGRNERDVHAAGGAPTPVRGGQEHDGRVAPDRDAADVLQRLEEDRAPVLAELQRVIRDRYRLPPSPWSAGERAHDTD